MQLNGEAYSNRLEAYTDDTIFLIATINNTCERFEQLKMTEIISDSELTEEQVAEKLRELLKEYQEKKKAKSKPIPTEEVMVPEVKTPKYWNDEVFQPLIEVKTVNGNSVKIPKKFTNGWQMAQMVKEAMVEDGLDPLDGLEIHAETNPLYYDLERVYYEIYEEDD